MPNLIKRNLLIGGITMVLTTLAMAAPVFTPQSQPTGWLSRPVLTFFDVSSGAENFYQIDFRKDSWAGNVLAKYIDKDAGVQTTGPWDNADPTLTTAASLLDARAHTDRKIATKSGPFRWASLSGADQTAIGSEFMVNFVRGDRSNEEPLGLGFRQRESVVGDILHSTIVYLDDGTNETLFVGSNDGMLHAFNAKTGVERWAYVPSMVIPNLNKLAEKTYVHTHFVDGPISIARMDINSVQRSILVGGLGAGGAGLYAFDVTTIAAVDEQAVANKLLWEITATGDFANLGNTYGTPLFARLNNGTAAVIIGNGYVNTGNGHAVLYVINAKTGALISAIDTGSGSLASPNGLSSPALYDTNGDGRPEFAYAGDIDGQLWKFDLINGTSSLLFTTSPVQAITTAPVVKAHPLGGQMVDFATGRLLTTGDKLDTSVHYLYGVWDGAPVGNTQTLTQTLARSVSNSLNVRTITSNAIDWATHKGWKIALEAGERVVGEKPFHNNGRFYTLVTNPTVDGGDNWLHEVVFNTGGSPAGPIFDLNGDGLFNASDLASNGKVPVAKFLGVGIFSQPRLVRGDKLATTLYAFHPDLPVTDGIPSDPLDPGVSGGHFDFDIYYYGPVSTTTVSSPDLNDQVTGVGTYCKKTSDIAKELDSVSKKGCVENPDIAAGYEYLTSYTTGAICKPNDDPKKIEYLQTTTCALVITEQVTAADYLKVKHSHEYDDKYDVTGVNMLNASLIDFNLINAIPDADTKFKILVMNQYLNPAAKLSVGGADYENVKTYGNLASQESAEQLISDLTEYSQNDIKTFIYNLPLDAFKAKDWWGDGVIRAGLIPTQTGCVNSINKDATMLNEVSDPGGKGLIGPGGERYDGALTFQLIDPETPYGQLELNGPDVTYGWRVKAENFKKYVLAEYTSFWHHPNKLCYGNTDWIPDPPEDFVYSDKTADKAPGSADPTDGIFGFGLAIISRLETVDGNVTTTVFVYSDGTLYTKTVTVNDDGSTTVHQVFRDGSEETVTIAEGDGGEAGFIDPNTGSPEEELGVGHIGRESWRDLIDN